MTGAPGRTPTLSKSSGGWGRTSGLRVFSATLLPPELHRSRPGTPARVEPGPAREERAMRSASPPKPQDPGAGIEPASTGSESVVLPLDDPGRSQQPVGV